MFTHSSKKKIYSGSLLFFLIILVTLSGCYFQSGQNSESAGDSDTVNESISLWIVTEKTVADGMNYQAHEAIYQFYDQHPNVHFRLDILPTDEAARSEYIAYLRQEISAGSGPDIFLLPTSNVLTLDEPSMYTYTSIEPLFPNVTQAMYDGIFLDISDYYASALSIDHDAFLSEVMDAGVIGSSRFVLPLRFNMPVYYVFKEDMDELSVDTSIFNKGVDDWMNYVIESGNEELAYGAEYASPNAFSKWIDYEKKEVSVSEAQVEYYLDLFQSIRQLTGSAASHRSTASIQSYIGGIFEPYPVQIGNLGSALDYRVIAELESKTLLMYPIKSIDEKEVAFVSYYAAVGANCKYPEYAYEYIQQFLSEKFQWEYIRPNAAPEQSVMLTEGSLPVLIKKAVTPLWESYKNQLKRNTVFHNATIDLQSRIIDMTISDHEISLLTENIDTCIFPITLSDNFISVLSRLNNINGTVNSEEQVEDITQEIIMMFYESITK